MIEDYFAGPNLLNSLMNFPRDKVVLVQYYKNEIKTIRTEVNNLLDYQISDEQFESMINAWHYRDLLVARCDQYNFSDLRDKIDELVQQIESILVEQKSTIQDVNFLCPVIDELSIQDVVFVNISELGRLKKLRDKLSRSTDCKGAKGYLTKRAYFELFFISELLGLPAVAKSGEKNNLITLAEIMTSQKNPNRTMLSEHYQKYEYFKKMNPDLVSLILTGKRRYSNNPKFSSSLEQFQTNIYPKIPIPSPK